MNDDILELLIMVVLVASIGAALTGLAYFINGKTCHAKWDATSKAEYGLFSGCMVNGIPEDAYVNKFLNITIEKGEKL